MARIAYLVSLTVLKNTYLFHRHSLIGMKYLLLSNSKSVWVYMVVKFKIVKYLVFLNLHRWRLKG